MKPYILSLCKLVFLFLLSFLILNVNVQAQDDDNKEKEQLQVIQSEIINIYSKKMEAVLKKDIARFDKMKADAEGIDKVKDEKGKKDAVDNYQKNHKGHYLKMMNSAGVNINSVLAHLKKKFSGYSFSSSDGISIDIEKVEKEILPENRNNGFINEMNDGIQEFAVNLSGPNPAAAGLFYTDVAEENNIILSPSKKINCALIAAGQVKFWSPNSMRASSSSSIAGGCSVYGYLQSGFTVPKSIRSMNVVVSGSLRHYGFVLAIGGFSFTATTTKVYVSSPTKRLFVNHFSKLKVAPLLWAATYNESRSIDGNVNVSNYKNQAIKIYVETYSYSLSEVVCATNGFCQINLPTVKKVFERQ